MKRLSDGAREQSPGKPVEVEVENMTQLAEALEARADSVMLDNFDHIKTFWVMHGLKVSQVALSFGADDIDGTVVEEKITHMAGATTTEALSKDDLVRLIVETGHVPVERDTLYRVVHEYEVDPDVGAVR